MPNFNSVASGLMAREASFVSGWRPRDDDVFNGRAEHGGAVHLSKLGTVEEPRVVKTGRTVTRK
jgi:hypothetical protein